MHIYLSIYLCTINPLKHHIINHKIATKIPVTVMHARLISSSQTVITIAWYCSSVERGFHARHQLIRLAHMHYSISDFSSLDLHSIAGSSWNAADEVCILSDMSNQPYNKLCIITCEYGNWWEIVGTNGGHTYDIIQPSYSYALLSYSHRWLDGSNLC